MVTRNGELVQLSRTEWLLLQHLAANAGKVVLHTELLTKVWGPEYRDDLQYLRVWVSRVRRKLGAEPGEPGRIKTFQGIGYLLDVEPPHAAARTPTSRPEPETRTSGSARVTRLRALGRGCYARPHAALRPDDGPRRRRRPERLRGPGRQPVRRSAAMPSSPSSTARSRRRARPGRSSCPPRTGIRRSTPHFAKDGGMWPVHCVADTWGADLHPALHRSPTTRRASARARTARTATRASRCATR